MEELLNLYVGPDGVVRLEPVLDENGDDVTKYIVEVDSYPIQEPKDLHTPVLMYDGKDFYTEYEVDQAACWAEIHRIKAYLKQTDYMVIKMYEALILETPAPYSVAELMERDTQRARLQEAEALLKTI